MTKPSHAGSCRADTPSVIPRAMAMIPALGTSCQNSKKTTTNELCISFDRTGICRLSRLQSQTTSPDCSSYKTFGRFICFTCATRKLLHFIDRIPLLQQSPHLARRRVPKVNFGPFCDGASAWVRCGLPFAPQFVQTFLIMKLSGSLKSIVQWNKRQDDQTNASNRGEGGEALASAFWQPGPFYH